MIQVLLAGLLLGVISSFHCVGMCGPLALSLPVQHLPGNRKTFALLLYNTGRVVTYSLAGLVFGLAGRKIYIAGFQQALSIICGVIILVFAIQYFVFKKPAQPRWLQPFYLQVQKLMGRALKSKNISGFFLLGMANGLLPCGMVYLAIAGSLATGNVLYSILFMALFGLGTLPAMMALGLLGIKMGFSLRNYVKKFMPYMIGLMAVLLILRGLNLGIPFISPVLANGPGQAISCEH